MEDSYKEMQRRVVSGLIPAPSDLKGLKEHRDILDREIKEREKALVGLSLENLALDLDHKVDPEMPLKQVCQVAAGQGTALTTTRHVNLGEGLPIVHIVREGDTTTFLDVDEAQAFVSKMPLHTYLVCSSRVEHPLDQAKIKKWGGK